MEKMTNAKALNYVLTMEDVALPTDVREKLEKIKASIEKKNGAEKKPTENQKANTALKVQILNSMEVGKAYTITDMIKTIPCLAELSNQKVSAIVRQMKEDGFIVRSEDKRKAYFTRVE